MKLGLYQGPSRAGDVADALNTVERILTAAAVAGAGLVVFPELFLPGYNQPDRHRSVAQPQGGAWELQLARIARNANCALAIGWAESADGRIYNAASFFDQAGRKTAHYRKRQLFGPMEESIFQRGNCPSIFEYGGVRTGLLICYDVEFPQHLAELRDKNVERVLVPTANPANHDNIARLIVPSRALEARMTIVYANYCGEEAGLEYGGLSQIVGPDGEFLAHAGRGEALLVADLAVLKKIDPAQLSTYHEDFRG